MVYGDARSAEQIQLNEDSLWTGDEKETGKYQTLGELMVDFEQGEVTGYRRALDLSTATETVEFTWNGENIRRAYYAPHGADVLMFEFFSDIGARTLCRETSLFRTRICFTKEFASAGEVTVYDVTAAGEGLSKQQLFVTCGDVGK